MNIQRLHPVLFGLILSGGLIAPAIAAPPSNASKQDSLVQHLTCVKDTQGLMCTTDEAVNRSRPVPQTSVGPATVTSSAFATNRQLEQVSDLLLGIMYFVLPIALVFAVSRYDQRDAEWNQSIERLERIWNQDPQV